jgi:hypothetical protein
MSSLTYEQAQDEILALFKEGWDTTTYKVYYEQVWNDRFEAEVTEAGEPFAQTYLNINGGRQVGFGGPQNRYARTGSLTVFIYTPSGNGLSQSLALAKVVGDCFEGKTSPGGVWFRSVNIQNMGRDGAFHGNSVSVFFTFDEIK